MPGSRLPEEGWGLYPVRKRSVNPVDIVVMPSKPFGISLMRKKWISSYLDAAGVQNRDQIKLQLRKNQHGNLYYLDAMRPNQRCLFVGELGGGGLTGTCTGTYLMYGAICLDSDSANVEKLDQQVFKLMNDLSFIGNKKELIKR